MKNAKEYAAKMAAANAAGNAWRREEEAVGAANVARDTGDVAALAWWTAVADARRVAALAASARAEQAERDYVAAVTARLLAEGGYRGRRPCPVCQVPEYEPEFDGLPRCWHCGGLGTLSA